MKKELLIAALSVLCYTTNAQNVNIPDAAFKTYLVGRSVINTNGDAEIQVSEAEAYSGNINLYYNGVSDLTGIEAFTALTSLYCVMNSLTALDLSKNLALVSIDCSSNKLTSLTLGPNTVLKTLRCPSNKLTVLDISANTRLESLSCSKNQLTSLNLSSNPALNSLNCQQNQLTSLDFSLNKAIEYLSCDHNQLTSLDLNVNTALILVTCGYNELTSLDLSLNTALIALQCMSNQLTYLNIANGNNHNFVDFEAEGNSGLTTIKVDDVSAITSNAIWQNTDPGVVFVDDNTVTDISDIEVSDNFGIYPNPASSVLYVQTYETTGIKVFTSLGEEVFSATVTQESSAIDVSALASGIYFVKTSKGEVKKFVKE